MRTLTEFPELVFRGLKIAYSWRCNARCAHCGVSAGPEEKTVLGRKRVLAVLDDAAELGLGQVDFTGGEIFLFRRDLLAFLERARQRGLRTALDSNGSWATGVAVALRLLTPLRERGLCRIVVSTDRYHREYVPSSRVFHLVDAARELGIETAVTVCAMAGDETLLDTLAALRARGVSVQVQRIAPYGRAAGLPVRQMLRSSFLRSGAPCDAALLPAVAPDGRVTLCCAVPTRFVLPVARFSPLVLGWLQDEPLSTILRRAARDPLLRLLAGAGAAGVGEALQELSPGLFSPRREGYFGSCDLCTELLASAPRVEALRRSLRPPSLAAAAPPGAVG